METTTGSVYKRQLTNGTMAPGGGDDQSSLSFESWLATYWYILLIVLAVLAVLCVLICACVLKKYPRSHSFQPHSYVPKRSNSSPNRSVQSHNSSSIPTIPSLSADSTPIPSPHSSQQSVGYFNGRNKRTSPRLSSTSSDTLRPDVRSVSSNSSASLMGHSPTRQQERNSPMERRGSLPRRTRPGSMVRVTSMPDVKENNGGSGLYSVPSIVSVESSSNGRSGISYKFQPSKDSQTFVEVGVTVHTPGDPDKAVRIATAAALAESARKLAQEAASFIDTGDENIYLPPLTRGSRPYHPSSGRSSSFSLSQPSYIPTHSYPVPITTANLDNPSTASGRVGGGVLRGEHYPAHNVPFHKLVYNYPNDSEYINNSNTSMIADYDENNYMHNNHSASPFQRGRPYRSSLDSNYNKQEVYLSRTRDRISSLSSARETSFNGRHIPGSPFETSRSKRLQPESSYSRKIPFHLTAAGRRQSAPSFNRRLESVKRVTNERGSILPQHVVQVPVEIEIPCEKPNEIVSREKDRDDGPRRQTAVRPLKSAEITPLSLTQSPSTSTGLSSTHSSQFEDHPSQENQSETSQPNNNNETTTLYRSETRYDQSTLSLDGPDPSSLRDPGLHQEGSDPLSLRSPGLSLGGSGAYYSKTDNYHSNHTIESCKTDFVKASDYNNIRPRFTKESSNESEDDSVIDYHSRLSSGQADNNITTKHVMIQDNQYKINTQKRLNGHNYAKTGNNNNNEARHSSSLHRPHHANTVDTLLKNEQSGRHLSSYQTPISHSLPSNTVTSNSTVDVTVNV